MEGKLELTDSSFLLLPPFAFVPLSVYCAALNASITANLQIEIGSYFKAGHLASWLGGSYLLGVAALTRRSRLRSLLPSAPSLLLADWLFLTIYSSLGSTLEHHRSESRYHHGHDPLYVWNAWMRDFSLDGSDPLQQTRSWMWRRRVRLFSIVLTLF